jgi:hypothetical protein
MESKRFPHRFILLPCQILKIGAAGVPGCWLTRKICGLLEGVCALTKPLASPGGRRSANTMVTSTQHSGSTPEPHKQQMPLLPENLNDVEDVELGIYNQRSTCNEETSIIARQSGQASIQFRRKPPHFLLQSWW